MKVFEAVKIHIMSVLRSTLCADSIGVPLYENALCRSSNLTMRHVI
jgi:hypothetical protein